MKYRLRIAATLLTVSALALAGLAVISERPPEPLPLRSLEDSIASYQTTGWHLAEAPGLPGPYRPGGIPHQSNVGGGGGARWRNRFGQASYKYVPEPGVEQVAIQLETADGHLTVVVRVPASKSQEILARP